MRRLLKVLNNLLNLSNSMQMVSDNLKLLSNSVQMASDDLKLMNGRLMSELIVKKHDYRSLAELEFKGFSQFGDDGIIQYLIHNLDHKHKTFIEFGVENYMESNTRFILQNNNWSGFIMDCSQGNINELARSYFFWKHDLEACCAFVTKENINDLLKKSIDKWGGVDLLHIDIDGNDYWVWEAITNILPTIVIIEYNSVFGIERAITVPYDSDFFRTNAHFSNLYWGSSLKALYLLAKQKGYEFIGCNRAGMNAYFIRSDAMNQLVRKMSLEDGYVLSKYRESRDKSGKLTYVSGQQRAEIIRGMPVFDIELSRVVPF